MSTFSDFLKKEISKNNYSQNKFAKEIGISSYYLGQLIKGEKRPPSREIQNKIVVALNFAENKKNEFYDLIAKEKNDIPSDIYDEIKDSNNWNEIRKKIKE
ncbi:MAG: helix-turn-helix transcriptional regulator [Clostridium sp.]|nr:helix-turn-helix transcriptional regulator [Clostridium sp.]